MRKLIRPPQRLITWRVTLANQIVFMFEKFVNQFFFGPFLYHIKRNWTSAFCTSSALV